MGLLRRMREKKGFSETESMIADYMLEHFRELADASVRQLAKNTYTSSAAIVRFSQKLGFEGYPDFKINFLAEMMRHDDEPEERYFLENDNLPALIDKIMNIGIGAIKETHDLLDPAAVARALHLMRTYDYYDFYGTGSNLYVANMMVDSLMLAGKHSSVHIPPEMQYLQAKDAPKHHLAIFLSCSGENRLLLKLAEELNRQGNSILSVTAHPKSTLAELSTVVLRGVTTEAVNEGGPRVFKLSCLYILHVMWGALLAGMHYKPAIRKSEWLAKNYHL